MLAAAFPVSGKNSTLSSKLASEKVDPNGSSSKRNHDRFDFDPKSVSIIVMVSNPKYIYLIDYLLFFFFLEFGKLVDPI